MSKLRISLAALAVFSLAFIITSCSDEPVANADQGVSDEVVEGFKTLGFDVSDIRKVNVTEALSSEEEGERYVVEGDMYFTMEDMKSMLKSSVAHTGPNLEQYRTNNLVSQGRTIRVIGYTGSSNGLTSKMQTALRRAVNNYNALNISLNFTLDFGTNYQSYDMVVYQVSGGGGGSAGFPSGGRPHKYIKINSGTDSYSTDVVEHVITHEMGHCVGMRHTDWFNRSYSCGSGGNEGDGGVGAVHIDGTPTGADPNSLMLSCFSSNEDGEFGSYDKKALERLY